MPLKSLIYLLTCGVFLSPKVWGLGGVELVKNTTSYTESGSSTNVNMGYGGVKWTFGESYVPEIVGGYRYASVTSSGATQGADISIALKVTGKMQLNDLIHLGKLRVKYLNGMDYLQGEVGGGWDFAKKGLFAGLSAQGPYVNTGLDYDFTGTNTFTKSFSPYVGFNSIGIYNTPLKNQTRHTDTCYNHTGQRYPYSKTLTSTTRYLDPNCTMPANMN
jgi:hypothetical protein